ncbi:caffeic acid 3-O-methyltransferase 1-like [Benincasa hispida]|uniref:caffeic acid 3-O-methyltransferase 1-like n=1 Tax=Benincasa hispida TaxID=102211 RepID=UPI0018FF1135|nr:caffeic acid 3-O-methyltransferase 1-like [Benincasa hispida]
MATINSSDEEHQHFAYAMQLASSSALPMTLQTAFELSVFEILARAGHGVELSPTKIAAEITTANPDEASMIYRILRLYSLNSVSKFYVRNEDGVSLGPMISLIQDKVFLDSWSELKNAIVEGGIRTWGAHAFEYPSMDPRSNKIFNTAMSNHATMVVKKIVESYKDFENIKQLVDVGGGLGVTLQIITSTYTSIKGINFDLPHVIQCAPIYPDKRNMPSSIEDETDMASNFEDEKNMPSSF